MNFLLLIFAAILFFLVYFAPWSIAHTRNTKYKREIFVFNLFFGWTVVGWLVTAIWAINEEVKK